MNCRNCGAQVKDGAKFCEHCGTRLEAEEQPTQGPETVPTQPATQAAEATPTQSTAPMSQTSNSNSNSNSNGKAIASLICGIASIVFSGTVFVSLILGIIAIVLGASAAKQTGDGKAKAGKVCGIIGIVFSVLLLVACVGAGFAIFDYIEKNPDDVNPIRMDVNSNSSSAPNVSSSAGASSSERVSAGESVYENKRFGYSLELPRGFSKTAESANGDGATFENVSLDMKVTVAGMNNVNSLTPEKLMETWFKGSPETTMESGSNYALFTQVEGNTMHFYYAYVGAGSINQLEITYPVLDDNSDQLDAAEDLVDEFQAGNIKSAC